MDVLLLIGNVNARNSDFIKRRNTMLEAGLDPVVQRITSRVKLPAREEIRALVQRQMTLTAREAFEMINYLERTDITVRLSDANSAYAQFTRTRRDIAKQVRRELVKRKFSHLQLSDVKGIVVGDGFDDLGLLWWLLKDLDADILREGFRRPIRRGIDVDDMLFGLVVPQK